MEIKKQLKDLNVKLSALASELRISRSTLNSYIDSFEKGQVIPHGEYQRIFEYLFSDGEINSLVFACRIDYVKRVMLAEVKPETEKAIQNNAQEDTVKTINDILSSEPLETPFVDFITLFIKNKEKDLVRAICLYFNFTNGFLDLEVNTPTDRDKALFSQLAKTFADYQSGTIEHLPEFFDYVVEKNKEAISRKKGAISDSEIVDFIKAKLDNGGNIDPVVLKQMLELREVKHAD